jgi:lipopolysaccharide biosynthesis glycosyltransferase
MMLIYTGADGNYALQAQVWMLSLVKTQRIPVRVVIFGNGWSKKNRSSLKSLENDKVKVEIREIDHGQFSEVRLRSGFPLATAYNILAPLYLLNTENRAIYMDADMVVTEDLSSLWTTQLKTPVGAVLDAHIVWISSPSMWRPWHEEGLPPFTPYLNSGLMLMDLVKWREEKLTERTLDFLEKYELPCVDQDALNLALRGKFDKLHPRYNSMPYHHLKMWRYLDTVESQDVIGEAITNPAIIHFHRSFFGKPWTLGCTHPGAKLWRNLADQVRPGWRKKLEITNYVRSIGARFAKMTSLDSRTSEYSSNLLDFSQKCHG